MTLNEHDLFNLCLEEGWEPLFLTSSNQSLKAIQSQLQRELNSLLLMDKDNWFGVCFVSLEITRLRTSFFP